MDERPVVNQRLISPIVDEPRSRFVSKRTIVLAASAVTIFGLVAFALWSSQSSPVAPNTTSLKASGPKNNANTHASARFVDSPMVSPSGRELKGTLEDAEHIIIFMQENRPYDHYYGTLKGGRGFADRTAPLIPTGEPIWYQHTESGDLNPLCGCMQCDLVYNARGESVKALLESSSCTDLVKAASSGSPSVKISEGDKCSDMISALRTTSIGGHKIGDELLKSTTCPAGLKVQGTQGSLMSLPKDHGKGKKPGYILPFHLPFDKSSATCMNAPAMGFDPDHFIHNHGRMDRWNNARSPDFGMSYFDRKDLPFYYALADTFTFGDAYFQSTFTATNPNRLHLFTGSNGLSVPNSGFCSMDDDEPGYSWETMGETLSKAGVSWQLFQEEDNFDDNAFAWFTQYRDAKPGEELFERGMKKGKDLVADFAAAVKADALPQVTIIVGPASLSEHATNHPADGEDLSARLLKVMGDPANSKVFEKSIFVLNYDEGGQFFDHLWSPVPPKSDKDGISTVTTEGELTLKEIDTVPAGNPIGLGFRVPLFVISPWSRGGYVYSEVTDHTSVIKLVEKRFGVRCPNISPWRRAVVGDLTASMDFKKPDFTPWPILPDTSANVNTSKIECDTLPAPTLPKTQAMPWQEGGTRPSRALPYVYDVIATPVATKDGVTLNVEVVNNGPTGVVIFMYDRVNMENAPRKYTVEANKNIRDSISIESGARYGYSAHGPNGFVRQFGGAGAKISGVARTRYDYEGEEKRSLVVLLEAAGDDDVSFTVTDNAYGNDAQNATAKSGAPHPAQVSVDVSKSAHWYDVSVSNGNGEVWRFMGRMETGEHTTSDPAMGSGKAPTSLPAAGYPIGLEGHPHIYDTEHHPSPPEWYRTGVAKWNPIDSCKTARSRMKDACWNVGHKDEL